MNRLFVYAVLCILSLGLVLACNSSGHQPANPEAGGTEAASPAAATEVQQSSKPFVDLDAVAFQNKMMDADVVLIDVRKPGEIAQGKIEGALEMDITAPDFEEKMLALDREKTYLVYCASGKRSLRACMMMSEKGFKKLYNLDGGYGAWQRVQEAQKQD